MASYYVWDKNAAQELVTHMDRKLTCDESEDLEKDLIVAWRVQIYPLMSLIYFLEPLSCRQ
jgi:hypothetical protein